MQIEGNNAGADDAIMLDKDGYVSETNATNIVSTFTPIVPLFEVPNLYSSGGKPHFREGHCMSFPTDSPFIL